MQVSTNVYTQSEESYPFTDAVVLHADASHRGMEWVWFICSWFINFLQSDFQSIDPLKLHHMVDS